jgi:hypothetical protein
MFDNKHEATVEGRPCVLQFLIFVEGKEPPGYCIAVFVIILITFYF